MAHDCRNERQAHQMTYAKMKAYIEQQEAQRKDKEEVDCKHKVAEKEKGRARSPSPRPSVLLEQHLTVIYGHAQGHFPRYKYRRHGLTQRRRQRG